MTDTRTRIRERREDRRKLRRSRERQDDERMAGFALQRAPNFSLARIFLGDRRAYKVLAGITAVGVLLWIASLLLG